ncbi:hypothetical protein Plhal304r1_c065g0152861 [Plasmopara halstedii]
MDPFCELYNSLLPFKTSETRTLSQIHVHWHLLANKAQINGKGLSLSIIMNRPIKTQKKQSKDKSSSFTWRLDNIF